MDWKNSYSAYRRKRDSGAIGGLIIVALLTCAVYLLYK